MKDKKIGETLREPTDKSVGNQGGPKTEGKLTIFATSLTLPASGSKSVIIGKFKLGAMVPPEHSSVHCALDKFVKAAFTENRWFLISGYLPISDWQSLESTNVTSGHSPNIPYSSTGLFLQAQLVISPFDCQRFLLSH